MNQYSTFYDPESIHVIWYSTLLTQEGERLIYVCSLPVCLHCEARLFLGLWWPLPVVKEQATNTTLFLKEFKNYFCTIQYSTNRKAFKTVQLCTVFKIFEWYKSLISLWLCFCCCSPGSTVYNVSFCHLNHNNKNICEGKTKNILVSLLQSTDHVPIIGNFLSVANRRLWPI